MCHAEMNTGVINVQCLYNELVIVIFVTNSKYAIIYCVYWIFMCLRVIEINYQALNFVFPLHCLLTFTLFKSILYNRPFCMDYEVGCQFLRSVYHTVSRK